MQAPRINRLDAGIKQRNKPGEPSRHVLIGWSDLLRQQVSETQANTNKFACEFVFGSPRTSCARASALG